MPKLSLWRTQKSNDYRFFDKTIKEMYTVGATDLYIHKYIGSNNPPNDDLTTPVYDKLDPTNIQDLMWLENRDRKYDSSIYRLRGHYNVSNIDFDLSQFGLFLSNDIIFITVHYNDMIDILGRKLMVGDVLELPHLIDYHPLNETIPVGLRRFYQVTDGNFASEGFSQTWFPHMWRLKAEPLVDSQEFADILRQPINTDNYMGDLNETIAYQVGYTVLWGDKIYTPKQPVPAGISPPDPIYWQLSTQQQLTDIISTYNKNIEINNKNLEEAARLVPKGGYNRQQLYVVPTYDNNEPAPPVNIITSSSTPNPAKGTIIYVSSPFYSAASPAISIGAGALNSLKQMAKLAKGLTNSIDKFISVSLQVAQIEPQLTSSGSGPISGTPVIAARVLGPITGPYGTADNTYVNADEYLRFEVRTEGENIRGSTILNIQNTTQDLSNLLVLDAPGALVYPFLEGTRIVNVIDSQTVELNFPIQNNIESGQLLIVSSNFKGIITQEMDYRADSDPRFTFIRRTSPRNFGYLAGYMAGTDEFPNGEATNAGIQFPANPQQGDYFLRIDYLPQKLFRYDGTLWVEISQNVRTTTGFTVDDKSQMSSFINNDGVVQTTDGGFIPSRQSLSNVLKIQPDL
jgi:hypothetical protein